MGLVNIPNINNGDSADATLWNSRFGLILAALNGNIDAANVKDGSLPYGKLSLADREVPSAKIGLTPTTGTNGGTAGGSTNYIQIGTFLICWGTTAQNSVSATSVTSYSVTFPVAFATAPTMTVTPRENTVISNLIAYQNTATTTSAGTISISNSGAAATAKADWIAIGKAAS